MNWRSRIRAVAFAGVLLTAGSARAQDAESGPDNATGAALTVIDKIDALAEAMGVTRPLLPRETLRAALTSALPDLPADDPRVRSTTFGFDIRTTVTSGELETGGQAVADEAADCARTELAGPVEVVRFRRIARAGLTGHECVITVMLDGVWGLRSSLLVEGPDRRLSAAWAVATTVQGEPETARALGEAKVSALVALSEALGDYGVGMLLEAETGAVDVESGLERLTALAAGMADED